MKNFGLRTNWILPDHCVILNHLVNKYRKDRGHKLFAAFLDLKAVFDSVPRELLWKKLLDSGMDKRLLFLIKKLHHNMTCQVRLSREGDLTPKFSTNTRVKQGCILALLLFNTFKNDLTHFGRAWMVIGLIHVPLLLYADDSVLLSLSQIGMKRLLSHFYNYCELNKRTMNFEKSKIMVFRKAWKPSEFIRGNWIKQVKHFRYLGIHFHYSNRWVLHRKEMIKSSNCNILAPTCFYLTKGNQYVPPPMRIFNHIINAKLVYGVPIRIVAFNKEIERIQSNLLQKILGRVPYAAICLETNLSLLETKVWLNTVLASCTL